jgi:hypothetical protein
MAFDLILDKRQAWNLLPEHSAVKIKKCSEAVFLAQCHPSMNEV